MKNLPAINWSDLDVKKANRTKLNTDTLKNNVFISACEKVGIPATRRQASKFRRKVGLAYQGK